MPKILTKNICIFRILSLLHYLKLLILGYICINKRVLNRLIFVFSGFIWFITLFIY